MLHYNTAWLLLHTSAKTRGRLLMVVGSVAPHFLKSEERNAWKAYLENIGHCDTRYALHAVVVYPFQHRRLHFISRNLTFLPHMPLYVDPLQSQQHKPHLVRMTMHCRMQQHMHSLNLTNHMILQSWLWPNCKSAQWHCAEAACSHTGMQQRLLVPYYIP